MDPEDFPDAVERAKGTELDRLGSQQLLVALTDADLDAETVLAAAAESEYVARETFERWADDESDAEAAAAFADVAAQERSHYERVAGELDDFEPVGDPDPMHVHLRDLEGTVERIAAGLVGRGLIGDRTHLQVVNFFVNEADERRADLFRDLRTDTRAGVETGAELLADRCGDEDEWERAREAAEAIIQVAYDDYADTLTGMGLDPKPIC